MRNIQEGSRFGRLVILRRVPGAAYECKCDCGKIVVVQTGHLNEKTRSCGCYRDEARRKHGGHQSPEYSTWEHVVQRCTNPKSDSYNNYGGRGIKMYPEWRDSFAAFLRDVGARPAPDYTIERIDNDGNYEPGNCKWIPKGEQSANTRRLRMLTYDGRTQPIFMWAKELGLNEKTLRTRLYRKWTIEQMFELKPQKGKKP